jgi:glycosyltransferase involved in cell wall biosynthesis
MNGAPLLEVAVVIPCFNQAHYLAEAIESALAQALSPLEIVVVDDGSEDNSHEVAGRYEQVRRLRQRNSGVAAARNAGLRATSGDRVVFLDADDRLLPTALEVGAAALERRPQVAFVSGASRDIGDDGAVLPGKRQPLVTQDHYLRLLEDCFIWSGSSIVYRRTALEAVGGFDESLSAGDDYDLYLRLARRFPVFCHETVVTEYRRHGTNTTRDPDVVLDSQLEVLRRQRSSVRDRREREARRRGIRKTRREHGRALADRIAEDWARRSRRRALRGMRTLVRHDPQGVAHLLGPA